MLSIENIHLYYEQQVLNGISMTIGTGEIIGIAGQSGAGKTSLLKIIAGLTDATEGVVSLNGKRIVGPSLKLIPGHPEVQLVNQDFSLDIYQTVEENIKGKILHLSKTIQQQFSEELLDLMELSDHKNRQAYTLSGGEQQRLAIARALALEPTVLLLDEPFVHLDAQLRIRLTSYLIELKNVRNMSIVIVSHNSEELLSLTDRIVYLKNGSIQRIAKPKDFYYKYKTVGEARMFGITNRVKLNEKNHYFRPDEYSTEKPEIALNFVRAIFMGGYYLNEFIQEKGNKIVLLNNEPLHYVKGISIKRKR